MGGALFFGALCRLRKSPSPGMALIAGLGWSIAWLIRPFESLPLLIVLGGLVAASLTGNPHLFRKWLAPLAVLLLTGMLAGGITALHNRAVTGSFITLPYQLSQRIYGVPQSLLWQKVVEEPALKNEHQKKIYQWQRGVKERRHGNPLIQFAFILVRSWIFYITPWYSIPVIFLLFLRKDKQILLGSSIVVCAMVCAVLYPFFFDHYISAYSCIIMFLIVKGIMALLHWPHIREATRFASAIFLVLGGSITGLGIVPFDAISGLSTDKRKPGLREQISSRVISSGGQHVIFVNYGADYSFSRGFVYNAVDIDTSPVVWCQAADPSGYAEVVRYYGDRQFWIANVDGTATRIFRYEPDLSMMNATGPPGRTQQVWVLEKGQQEQK